VRVGNLRGRLVVLTDATHAVDVERASEGGFVSDPQAVFERWDEFLTWVSSASLGPGQVFSPRDLGPPVPRPRQVFVIGMNYWKEGDEAVTTTRHPVVFTKFVTAITGPYAQVENPGGEVDWEVELVLVVGRGAYRVHEEDGWDYLAGVTVGLDLGERTIQREGPVAHYSLGKSFPGFGPIGPSLVTVPELADRDNLELTCFVNGKETQRGSTAQMLFSVPRLVSSLSTVTPLLPGDIVFTGTPSGGDKRTAKGRFLSIGDEVVGDISGIGELRIFIVEPRLPTARNL